MPRADQERTAAWKKGGGQYSRAVQRLHAEQRRILEKIDGGPRVLVACDVCGVRVLAKGGEVERHAKTHPKPEPVRARPRFVMSKSEERFYERQYAALEGKKAA